jgi:hypothetical protein
MRTIESTPLNASIPPIAPVSPEFVVSIRHYSCCLLAVLFVSVTPVIRTHAVAQDQASPVAAKEDVKQASPKKDKKAKKDNAAVAKEAAQDGADDKQEDASEAIAMRLQLELLQVRRKRLGLNFGDAHPTMLRLDDEIKSLQKKLEAEAMPKDLLQRADPKALESMKEEELRELVGELVKRVLVLEKEVHALKESPTISRRFPR